MLCQLPRKLTSYYLSKQVTKYLVVRLYVHTAYVSTWMRTQLTITIAPPLWISKQVGVSLNQWYAYITYNDQQFDCIMYIYNMNSKDI